MNKQKLTRRDIKQMDKQEQQFKTYALSSKEG